MNIRIYVHTAGSPADFTLTVYVVDPVDDQPLAAIANLDTNDPKLNVYLRDIFKAFRMGANYGRKEIVR